MTVSPQQGKRDSQKIIEQNLSPEDSEGEVDSPLWVRQIDDANRRAYSLLGAGSLVLSALLWGLLFYPTLSLYTVIVFLLMCPVVLIIGRFTLLRRYETTLRLKAQKHAQGNGTDLGSLIAQLEKSERNIFFLKLFSGEVRGDMNRQNHREEGQHDV